MSASRVRCLMKNSSESWQNPSAVTACCSRFWFRKTGDRYELIAGERRWRAAKLAGFREVPVIVREYTRQQTMEIALIENVQRADLNPIEEAQAYRCLIEEFGLKQDEAAKKVSKSRTAVTNAMRLLKIGRTGTANGY